MMNALFETANTAMTYNQVWEQLPFGMSPPIEVHRNYRPNSAENISPEILITK